MGVGESSWQYNNGVKSPIAYSLPSKIYARRELTTIRDLQCSIRLILVTFYVWIFYIRLVGIICPKYSEFPQNLSLHFYYYWQHCILFLYRPKGTILCWLWALCVPYHLTKLTQFLQSTFAVKCIALVIWNGINC